MYGKNFRIDVSASRQVNKYNTYMRDFQVFFNNLPPDFISSMELLSRITGEILYKIKEFADTKDKLKIYINHPELSHPISLPFMQSSEMTPMMLVNQISKVLQSNKKLALDNRLTFHTLLLKMPKGAGKRLNDFVVKKHSIVRVKDEKDSLCALRAIVIGKALADKDLVKYNTIRDIRNNLQTREAYKLALELNFPLHLAIGLEEIHIIECYLQDYQLIVIDSNALHQIVYMGEQKCKKIILYCHDNHFYVINSLNAFYSSKHFCFECKTPYSSKYETHPCNNVCKKCLNRLCSKSNSKIKCEFCGVRCSDELCFIRHLEKVCGKVKKCDKCNAFKTYKHNCNGKWCKYCNDNVDKLHKCYILREEDKQGKSKPFNGFIFFDYEALHDANQNHIPNLVVVRKICTKCLNEETCQDDCDDYIFNDNDSFCEWLFKQKHFIAIAHNCKAYDGYFIMQYIIKNLKPNEPLPECVLSGSKLLTIQFCGIKIIDSINFIPMALSKLPQTFGLTELKKGYFPHYFNILENQDYIGAYPDPSYYGVEYFQRKECDQFYKWYETTKDETFNLKQELLEYCKSDVDILAKASLIFRKLFMNLTKKDSADSGVDPFQCALTIASACHLVYRRNFMPKDSIALIPDFGYQHSESTSYKARIWLKHISVTKDLNILHALNGKEKQIDQYKLDGWCDATQTGYEFHGCVFHGCQKCYSPDTYNAILNETMGNTYERHLKRIEFLKSRISLVELWECEFDKMVKTDQCFKDFVKSEQSFHPPLNPRNALAGGRTNAIVLHYRGSAGYVDFTSLYPYVQKYGIFPIDHPTVITENFKDLSEYFGLVYCRVLPPQNLYLPVLPYHTNGKLMFPLCAACADNLCESCTHLPNERELEGTWVILEVLKALKKGYTVRKIFEVWHFDRKEQYNCETKEGGLFTKYVNTFLKIKQEASGYPNWVSTEEDKNLFIEEFYKHEGIILSKEIIMENSGKKALAKLMLNSQWGRYAMQSNKTQSKFITTCEDLYKVFLNKQFEVKDLIFPTDEVAIAFYENKKEMHWGSNQTNVVLAAFVTSQARLKLYSELEKLEDRVLYFDTDSIIYKKIPGQYEPVLGDYLGEFTNEIDEKDGHEIIEFVSAGPKNYAYTLNTGISYCKVKGFSLNCTAEKLINFERMKEIVCNENSSSTKVCQNTIVRDKKDWSLKTKTMDKVYRLVYDKRVIMSDLSTLPYGYKI